MAPHIRTLIEETEGSDNPILGQSLAQVATSTLIIDQKARDARAGNYNQTL